MDEVRHCAQCGAELPPDAPEGVCPKCVLAAGFASRSSSDDEPAAGPEPTAPFTPSGRFLAPEPADLAPRFPQLEILELLGQGGMGAVYKARQRQLNRLVALKILPPEVATDPTFAERFTREAQALAQFSHPHVVTIHDFGEADGLYYFLMEYVNGVNLRRLIADRKLEPHEALAIVPQICEALQYAHDEGVVHRDIKPENILIDKKGRVKIADFGLAKLLRRAAGDSYTLTGPLQVMGTPHYMAPEQMERPQSVDHRADIYSLGVVFYEMLTGELPLGRFAPPSQKVRVDVRLDEVVLRSLDKEPERRYQQASELKTDVESISRVPAPKVETDAPSSQPQRRPFAITILGIASILIAAFWGLQFAFDVFAPDVSKSMFPKSVQGNPVFNVWIAIGAPLHFVATNVLLVAGIGMLLLKRWARTASLGYALLKIAMFVIEVPLYMMFLLVPSVTEARAKSPDAASQAVVGFTISLPIIFFFELFYPILLLVILQRPKVKAAFDERAGRSGHEAPAPAGARSVTCMRP